MKLVFSIQYDGTDYAGWQVQPDAITVQGEIQKVLKGFGIDEIPTAAGRTDAGVHGRNMTAHVGLTDDFRLPIEKTALILNKKLPKDILIKDARIIEDDDFHSRFSAIARQYSYFVHTKPDVFLHRFSTLYTYPVDFEILKKSAEIFRGEHDFSSFSKINPDIKNMICQMETCYWEELEEGKYRLEIKADHFLYGMVRSLVGAMLDCARGKRSLEGLRKALDSKVRNYNSPLAPPNGLFFEKAFYPKKYFL
jgi:tRNA pseudouridine38-40 synthase